MIKGMGGLNVDAIILAGALNNGPLRQVSPAKYEAAIEIDGRPMLEYVIAALRNVSAVQRIVVVGDPSLIDERLKGMVFQVVAPGESLMDSLINGVQALQAKEPVLVMTGDIPLISGEALEDFIDRCRAISGDVYYSFVSRESSEKKYPGVERTYVKLKEGVFTGGNVVLLSQRVVRDHLPMLKKAASLRKKPVQLCLMLGWKFLLKLIMGHLKIAEIEGRIFSQFHFKAVGVISPYPEIGIDVDKPSDLKLVQRVCRRQSLES